jgi:hypothetical protein
MLLNTAKIKRFIQCSGSGSGLIQVSGSGSESRRAKINHKNREKVRKFHVMKCWIFFRGLKASPEARTSFMEV